MVIFRMLFVLSLLLLQALKILHHSAEFLPYVIFLSAPTMACMRSLANQGKENGHNYLSSVSQYKYEYHTILSQIYHPFYLPSFAANKIYKVTQIKCVRYCKSPSSTFYPFASIIFPLHRILALFEKIC